MQSDFTEPPRRFRVGDLEISDHGKIYLGPWEMISIFPDQDHECNVTATDWGLYLAPSLNGRLRENGFRAALVRNPQGKLFLNAVLLDRMDQFHAYLKDQGSALVAWLDEDRAG